jgi:hypothetical protein
VFHTGNGNLLKLSLLLLQSTDDLCVYVSGTRHMALTTPQVLEDPEEIQDMILALSLMFGSACDV